jgi:indole-3-glycerol phosphate synthase
MLKQILSSKKIFLEERKKEFPLEDLKEILGHNLSCPRFFPTLSANGIHLIAEIKKASPSAGLICKDFDLVKIVRAYAQGGAACLSVLTDEEFFQGHLSYLGRVRDLTSLPLLRKDFIIDEYQLYESKVFGADAVLLIATLLDKNRMEHFLEVSKTLKLDVVCEVHTEEELDCVLETKASIIGINTRDLSDFSLHLDILPELIKKIPKSKLIICESGIKDLSDLEYIKKFRINAVLVGEALMRAKDTAFETKKFSDFLKNNDKN